MPTEPENRPADEKPGDENVALKMLEDIRAKLDKPEDKIPENQPADPAAIRDEIKKRTGWTDAQLNFHEQSVMEKQAPVVEELAWLKIERSHKDLDTYRKSMQEEISKYPVANRTPELMEQVFWMVKGREIDRKGPPDSRPAGRPSGDVVSRRVAPGYSGGGAGMSGGGTGDEPEEDSLNADEGFVSDRLGVARKDYALAKKAKTIKSFYRPPETQREAGPADKELNTLLRGNKRG